MSKFFKRLSYSIGNEDWATEKKALLIGPEDTILTVTASGDRPLNLLHSPCKKLIALDANPFQTALCDLKKAALLELEYEEYLSFLGLQPHDDRVGILKKLEHHMSTPSILCWRENKEKIKKGISYQGQIEKICQYVSKAIKSVDGKKIELLFSFDNIEDQKNFIEEKWNWKNWKRVIDFALHPFFSRFFIKDPGLYKNVGKDIRPATYLYQRLEKALKSYPVKENLIASLVLQGKVFQEGYSPHLLEKEGKEIKKNLGRLSLETVNLITYLENAPENSIDCFSLSDVVSYMSQDNFFKLCRAIKKTAKPNARFCIRQFMSAYEFPEELSCNFERNSTLEKELEEEDRCFVYRFTVGKIHK